MYYDSSIYFPSQNRLAYNAQPSQKYWKQQSTVNKMTVEVTTQRTNPLSTNKPEKVQSLPTEIKTNFRILHAIQLSKDKFRISQVYPIEINGSQGASLIAPNGDGFATSTSVTSADNPVSIPALGPQSESSFGGATLILEPSSKALAGNGGTAISSPVSHAILRKNMGTRVLYRPESVAIAGVGGTAHAQSDLILDYVE